MTVTVLRADARNLPLADASVHAVVCDPPYGLEFMGREWDKFGGGIEPVNDTPLVGRQSSTPFAGGGQRVRFGVGAGFGGFCRDWAREAYRVLKPGGWLLAFGGTRTWHRLCCGIEDAGFEIRDTITWLYGSGFPKSRDVSKAIDKAAGAEREVVGRVARDYTQNRESDNPSDNGIFGGERDRLTTITAPATDDARRWQGWGTALKPASEPIVVARKPLAGTVAQNVQAHGTGALNIDACRVAHADDLSRYERSTTSGYKAGGVYGDGDPKLLPSSHDAGRWPSNVVLSHVRAWDGTDACAEVCMPGCPVAELDRQSGVLTSGANPTRRGSDRGTDSGGASRFFPTFRYEAKAPGRERPRVDGVAHPTVKPLSLMRWLVRLVTPPGGIVLDPFAGSGTTAEAALLEGFDCITCDLEPSHLPLIAARTRRSTGVAVDVPLFDLEGA